MSSILEEITSDAVLDEAYQWLCHRREGYSQNDDVWEVRQRWAEIKPRIQRELLAGRYRLSPQRRIQCDKAVLEIWAAVDSLVLKAVAIILTRFLAGKLSSQCSHVVGNGGAKAAVRFVLNKLPENKFVFRTDVKSYYASISHDILLSQLKNLIDDQRLIDLLGQYLQRVVYDDGRYHDIRQGISLGCPISPLMGALFLDLVDRRMEATGLAYVRFMDDGVVLAPTRWKLRKAIRIVNETLAELEVEQHPDKTCVGYIERGYGFLGYEFNQDGLIGVAEPTRQRFVERVHQLYEQGADQVRIGKYVRRWLGWVNSGLDGLTNSIFDDVLQVTNHTCPNQPRAAS